MSTEFILYTVIIHNGFDMVLSLVRETKTAETETRPRPQASRPRRDRDFQKFSETRPRRDPHCPRRDRDRDSVIDLNIIMDV